MNVTRYDEIDQKHAKTKQQPGIKPINAKSVFACSILSPHAVSHLFSPSTLLFLFSISVPIPYRPDTLYDSMYLSCLFYVRRGLQTPTPRPPIDLCHTILLSCLASPIGMQSKLTRTVLRAMAFA